MKQSFICTATLALLFAACKKEDAATTPPVIVTKYVQSIISDTGDSSAVEFNIDKSVYKLIRFGLNQSFTATIPSYESGTGNITTVNVTIDPLTYSIYQHQIITYNSTKLVSTISFYGFDGSLENIDSLSYSDTGNLDTIYYFKFNYETNKNELRSKYAHTWDAKGNIVKQEEISLDPEEGNTVTTYTYDDKINPALKLKGYYLLNFDEDDVAGLLSANNILTSSTVDAGRGYSASTNNTYAYDADDYPVVMTLRSINQYSGQDPYKDSVKLRLNYGQ
jgi:hypothetical protein